MAPKTSYTLQKFPKQDDKFFKFNKIWTYCGRSTVQYIKLSFNILKINKICI